MTKDETPFEVLESFEVEFAPTKITKWRSKRTGLQICYIDQPSPIVQGYFAVATEIDSDSGSPHTLEHLVFMGSEKYPYKGFLDTLGNRFFSSTNAWTAVDQTVYNMTTAGWEGFRTLLPIYLEHVLNPTLTDEACLTEVYHVDGKGEEKGVVFCEMQGIENQSWFLSFLELQKTLYSEKSGYASETGGLTHELRHLTNEQIRDFHKALYRPDNLSVIITGSIDEQELIQIMSEFDNQLIGLPEIPNKRPFVDSFHDEPLKEVIVKEIDFPDKDESMGEVLIGWIGPKFDDNLTVEANDMFGAYLTSNPNSLFNKNLIEIEDPLATEVSFTTDDYWTVGTGFSFNGVPTERLSELDQKVKDLMKEQADPSKFDLKLMKQVIKQQKLKMIFECEKQPSFFQNCAVIDFIYSSKPGSLKEWCKDLKVIDVLESWTAEDWAKLVDEQFVQNKSASILGKPSSKLNKVMKQQKKQFKQDTADRLGKEGLKKLEKQLEHAKAQNDKVIPDELLTQFGKPDVSNISFIETKSYKAGTNELTVGYETEDAFANQLSKDDLPGNPLFFHLEDFKSEFVTISVVMSTKHIPKEYLRYLSIMEEIFNMPNKLPDNTYIPFEDVINQLNDDLIEYQLDNGFDSQLSEFITIKIKSEIGKYDKAVEWLFKIMTMNCIEQERIKVIIEKINNSLPEKKRSGELMMYSKQYRTLFSDQSIRKQHDSVNNEQFFQDLLTEIDNDNFKKIETDLENFKKQLFNLNNFKIFINGNCKNLNNPISTWDKFIKGFQNNAKYNEPMEITPISKLPRSHELRSEVGLKCADNAYIVALPAADSSHLITSTLIPVDYLHEDIFKIALASEYLNAVEGPFWRGIRGDGLAYGTSLTRSLETGYLSYSIFSSSDAEQAWIKSKKIVSEFCDSADKFDTITIENCISAIVNIVANTESNIYDASFAKITDNVLRERGPNYKAVLIEKLKKVTADDLLETMNKYIMPLFEANSSVLFTCVPTTKSNEFEQFLTKQGYKVEVEEINSVEGAELETESETESETDLDSDSDSGSDSD